MRTFVSPKTGVTWKLCAWNEVCQMPVSSALDERSEYCRWHKRCLTAPQQGGSYEHFLLWHAWLQQAYPSSGWWGRPPEQLWPVLQGVHTIWHAEAVAA